MDNEVWDLKVEQGCTLQEAQVQVLLWRVANLSAELRGLRDRIHG